MIEDFTKKLEHFLDSNFNYRILISKYRRLEIIYIVFAVLFLYALIQFIVVMVFKPGFWFIPTGIILILIIAFYFMVKNDLAIIRKVKILHKKNFKEHITSFYNLYLEEIDETEIKIEDVLFLARNKYQINLKYKNVEIFLEVIEKAEHKAFAVYSSIDTFFDLKSSHTNKYILTRNIGSKTRNHEIKIRWNSQTESGSLLTESISFNNHFIIDGNHHQAVKLLTPSLIEGIRTVGYENYEGIDFTVLNSVMNANYDFSDLLPTWRELNKGKVLIRYTNVQIKQIFCEKIIKDVSILKNLLEVSQPFVRNRRY
ncbi:hypothetical protein [[Acholeplasma] multilocale]|uniref:hypothetical protein n=1 Tax=[Acholeplasma] multilocale TaxID=264638 RepID=UPI00047C8904|nr:hypothetical protein [[Acholeplasma] multilocale]